MSDDGDTSIKVSKAARERLGLLATEQGTTIRGLVEELARTRPTQAELQARGEAARAYLRDHMSVEVTDDDLAAGDRILQAMHARLPRHPSEAA
ncbi:hypothetical protein [Streptomyces sp. bgisy100]|uniref:hypothetical protein n=1 Tax=Streptomyces sp. bgisy100 TaxID=3413783 RepID=UPI003D74BAF2